MCVGLSLTLHHQVKNPDYVAVAWLTPFKPAQYSGSRRTFLKVILSGALWGLIICVAAMPASMHAPPLRIVVFCVL